MDLLRCKCLYLIKMQAVAAVQRVNRTVIDNNAIQAIGALNSFFVLCITLSSSSKNVEESFGRKAIAASSIVGFALVFSPSYAKMTNTKQG